MHKNYGLNELREMFLKFFETKGHLSHPVTGMGRPGRPGQLGSGVQARVAEGSHRPLSLGAAWSAWLRHRVSCDS